MFGNYFFDMFFYIDKLFSIKKIFFLQENMFRSKNNKMNILHQGMIPALHCPCTLLSIRVLQYP